MCVHLIVNASVLESPAVFQKNVYGIHSLGSLLPWVEWIFIFIPIFFHAIIGFVIIGGGVPNSNQYRYGPNYRYVLQRATGMIAFVFIMVHVFHMHGWVHGGGVWLEAFIHGLGGAQFRPFNAASSAGEALQNVVWVILYVIGILACVYHLANGVWTMGITWGVWTSPTAQARASTICSILGVLLAVVGLSALFGMKAVGTGKKLEEAIQVEDQMYQHQIEAGLIEPNEQKRTHETLIEPEEPAVQSEDK